MPALAALVAAIVEGIGFLLTTRLGTAILSALLFFGLNFTTFTVVMEPTFELLRNSANGIGTGIGGNFGAHAFAWMGVMQLDRAITMLISAYVTKTALQNTRMFLSKSNA